MPPAMKGKRLLHGLALAVFATAVLGGCGEKEEPAVQTDTETTPRTTENDILADITGAWEGEVRQKGLKPFEVRALIRSPEDSRQSTVHYSGIDCSGTWTVLNVKGKTVSFLESIERGEGGDCEGTGKVEITPEPGEARLAYEFRGDGAASSGTLHRVEN